MRKGEPDFVRALLTKMEDKRKRRKMRKMPVSHRPDLSCSFCDRLCHSAIGKGSHERACLARLAKDKQIFENLERYLQNICKDEKNEYTHIYERKLRT
jgi:hypothetical protein